MYKQQVLNYVCHFKGTKRVYNVSTTLMVMLFTVYINFPDKYNAFFFFFNFHRSFKLGIKRQKREDGEFSY